MFTHYTLDDSSERAYCGHRMTEADRHSPVPSCSDCAARLAAEIALEEAIDATPVPLDADEAALVLDPVLNAGVPPPIAPTVPDFSQHLFQLAVSLNQIYAAEVRRTWKGGR